MTGPIESRDAAVPDSIERIETPRLVGRLPIETDFEALHAMHVDGSVMATLGGVKDDTFTRRLLVSFIDHWRQHGFGVWIFEDKARGAFVGRGGLHRVRIEGEPVVEIMYALTPSYWGRGLASEIARASAAVAFDHLDLGEVVSFTLPTNKASQGVMKRVGMAYERDITHAQLPHVVYRLKREDWGN